MKVIIFDLDGVLVDTENIHFECLVEAINFVTGLPENKFVQFVKSNGQTTTYKLNILKYELTLSDFQIKLIDDRKQQNVINRFNHIETSPDLYQMLTSLKMKYKLALASNSRKENVMRILNILNITSFFSQILTNNDVRNHKPDPDIFLTIMEREHVLPNETLILEDSLAGKYAAISSGAHLFSVDSIADVTLENIRDAINKADNSSPDGGYGDKIL